MSNPHHPRTQKGNFASYTNPKLAVSENLKTKQTTSKTQTKVPSKQPKTENYKTANPLKIRPKATQTPTTPK